MVPLPGAGKNRFRTSIAFVNPSRRCSAHWLCRSTTLEARLAATESQRILWSGPRETSDNPDIVEEALMRAATLPPPDG